ncbi:uncharacterized protein isoform X1 [Choristoneura fumiferana]|uniref:uncharacterized protein isoform X1 n=3 Tax=Choristoneura fumiferana TaxID=7141 RepID=UPI003D15EC49
MVVVIDGNSIHKTGRPAGRDTKIYLVSELKMHQQRTEAAQQHKEQHCNLHSSDDAGVVRIAPRHSLKQASSIVLVMPRSCDEMSTEDCGSLIYVEKLEPLSKLKTIKIVPHENTQTANPIKILRHHTRNEGNMKPSVEPRRGKCTITRPVPASHKLPVTNAFTKEYSSGQLQKPRIPPKYSDYSKVTTEPPTWNKELYTRLPSCSTTCRLDMRAEQRIGRSEQRTPPRYVEKGPKSTEPACGNKDALYKALARYLHSTKRIVCKEKPEQRIATKNSRVCLLSATHSSIYRVHSRVSFSDELRYLSRGNSSKLCMEKCLDPSSPTKSPSQGPNECKNSHDHSLCCSSDEKAKRLRERIPQFTIKISPKLSKSNIKTPRSAKGSKVRFDRQLHSCCPCEKTESQKSDPTATIDELRPCASEKKTIIKSEPNRSKKEPKPRHSTNKTSQQSHPDNTKDELRPCANEKKEAKKSESDCPIKEPKPCSRKKNTSQQSASDLPKNESNPCEKKKTEDTDVSKNDCLPYVKEKKTEQSDSDSKKKECKPSDNEKRTAEQSDYDSSKNKPKPCENKCDTDVSKNQSKPCKNEKKTSEQSDSDSSRNESRPREKNKTSHQRDTDLSKNEKEAEKNKKTIEQQPDPESTCETVAKETKKIICDLESPCQTPTDEQSILTKESSSQCRETVKRASSPMNVDVKSTGVDGSSTLKPRCLVQKPRAVCPEKDKTPEKPLYICKQGSSASFGVSENICTRKKPTMNSIEKQPSDKSVELEVQTNPEPNLTRVPTMQPTNECVKQQIITEEFCPPNLTPDQATQLANVCDKLNDQVASQCRADPPDSISQSTDENVKLKQQTPSTCPADSTQDSVAQPAEDNSKICKQTVSECPATSVQEPKMQPADKSVKSSDKVAPESSANLIQDSETQLAKDNAKSKQDLASECPTNSVQDAINQPTKEKDVSKQDISCQPPVESSNDTVSEQPAQAHPDPPAKNKRKTCSREPRPTEPKSKPCSKILKYVSAFDNKDKKHGRVWWCNKKQILLRRRGHPAPLRSVEDNSMETQCERDVKDLAQMTDDILRMTGDPEKCLCSVKPCKCLHELAQTITNGGSTTTKPTSECECPPPLLIIKKNQQENYKNDENVLREQQSLCSCIAFLQKHNLLYTGQTIVNQTATEVKGLGQKSEQQADAPYIYSLNDLYHFQQNKTAGGASKAIGLCECGGSKPIEPTAGDQNNNDVTCQGIPSGSGSKKNIVCECPPPMTVGQNGKGGSCPGMMSDGDGKKKITCECLQPKATEQNGKDGPCQGTMLRPGGKENIICECPPVKVTEQRARGQNGKTGTFQGMSESSGKKNTSFECPRPNNTANRAGAQNGNFGTCPPPGSGGMNVICECPPLKATEQAPGSQYGNDGRCQCMKLGPGGKIKVTCECPLQKITEQTAGGPGGKDGPYQCMKPGPGGKKNIICECPRSTPSGLTPGQICRNGTCQGVLSGPCGAQNTSADDLRPTTIVKEQTTAVQCKKGEQRSCDNLAKVETGKKSEKSKLGRYKKTVICESPSKDKLQLRQAPAKAPCPNTVGSNKITLSVKKKSPGQAGEGSSSEECTECQNNKTRVKWCKKKYVISECPPLREDDNRDSTSMSSQKKKHLKKNVKNQAKIKTGEKKVDTSCTHGSTPCLCKDEPFCRLMKNHKCECPCPLFVEEVDLNPAKDCPSEPPCPKDCPPPPPPPPPCLATDENEKKSQKKNVVECDQGQMTQDKIDKCSYTDRPIKNICKTKNKSSGQGKWGKKKIPPCICPPEPPTTERGCDPPCVKEQWKMKSRETCNKSGFSVKKKPAARVDHTMCFEEALAYFELHPEDDPMQKKKKKKVICECPSS